MNSLYGAKNRSNGSSAVTLEQHFWPRRIKERTATLIVSGFSPQVRSARKNVVGAYGGGHFCSGALEMG